MADIDLCPRCQSPLKFVGATSCQAIMPDGSKCGWKKRERTDAAKPKAPERVPVDCCYEGCRTDAVVRRMTKTGWANMCPEHHRMHTLAEAKAYTKAQGLTTPQEMREWIKSRPVGRGRMHGAFLAAYLRENPAVSMREPGQDDEELAA